MPDDFGNSPPDGSLAAQPNSPPQAQGGFASGAAGVATTGVFIGREFSETVRKGTDKIAKAGLGASEKAMEKMAKHAKKFADSSKDIKGNMSATGKVANSLGKGLDKGAGALGRMKKAVDGISGGFANISQGSGKAFMAMFQKGNRLKGFAAGLGLVSKGFLQVAASATAAMAPLLPFIAAIAAVVAIVKLVKETVKLFADEITDMKNQALEPWRESFEGIAGQLKQLLAPAIAFVMVIIKSFWQIVKNVGEAMAPLFEKMSGETGGILEQLGDTFANVFRGIVSVIQFFVDAYIRVVNMFKVISAVFRDDAKTTSEKWKTVWKVIVGVLVDAAKQLIDGIVALGTAYINYWEKMVNGLVWIWKKIWNLIITVLRNKAVGILTGVAKIGQGIVDTFANAFKEVTKIVVNGMRKVADSLSKLGKFAPKGLIRTIRRAASELEKFSTVTVDIEGKMQGAIEKIKEVLTPEKIGSFREFMESEMAINLDGLKDDLSRGADKIKEMLDGVKEKFGVDLQEVAGELGVDLLESPDLLADFEKLLAEAKIKLADEELNEKLGDLGEKIDTVNDKDVKIEINPLIQVDINNVEDPEAIRAIVMDALDEGLANAGAQLAQDANSGEL